MDYLPNNIEDGYEYAVTIVRKNVSDEKDRRDQKGEKYSHCTPVLYEYEPASA